MDRTEFALAYSNEMKPSSFVERLPDKTTEILQPFLQWDETLGNTLLDEIVTVDATDDEAARHTEHSLKVMKGYQTFLNRNNVIETARALQASINTSNLSDSDKIRMTPRTLQAFNFHILSACMMPAWCEMLELDLGRSKREYFMNRMQFGLASYAVQMAEWRSQSSSIQNNHTFYSDQGQNQRAYITGALAEIDAAITLLELSRANPDLSVVPAPKRFEDSNQHTNVDFIVYSKKTNEIAGVQVKANSTEQDHARYDAERVVIIDSVHDMGGRVWVRTKAGTSSTSAVPWPGMVSLDYLSRIKIHGKQSSALNDIHPHNLLNIRRQASELLKPQYDSREKITGSLATAKKNVADKIFPYLAQTTRSQT